MKKQKEYALYKGDKFIDLGTLEYLSKKLNVEKRTISFYSKPSYLKRSKGNSYIVIKIEDDEEWNQL